MENLQTRDGIEGDERVPEQAGVHDDPEASLAVGAEAGGENKQSLESPSRRAAAWDRFYQ